MPQPSSRTQPVAALPAAQQFLRTGRAAGEADFQAGKIGLGEILVGAQSQIKRRRAAGENGDLAALEFLQHQRRLVGRHDVHEGAQIDRHNQREAKAPDVKQRRDVEDAFRVERKWPDRRDAVAIGHQTQCRVIGAFGHAGGAAGEEQRARGRPASGSGSGARGCGQQALRAVMPPGPISMTCRDTDLAR